MNVFTKIICNALAITFLGGCAPQAQFFNVDVKSQEGKDLQLSGGKVAIFSINNAIPRDSIRIGNVALGLAAKLELDRSMKAGEIPVFSIPQTEFRGFDPNKDDALKQYDREYLRELMLKTEGDVQIFVNNLKFYQYSINKQSGTPLSEYGGISVLLPYSVEVQAYNTLKDSLLYSRTHRDTIYLQMVSIERDNNKISSAITSHLPDVSRKIGESIAAYFTIQWETQERMLITYSGELSWEKPYDLAQEFKWKEAIDLWMPLTSSPNPRKAAFAAYNIAVACEMSEQFPLATDWILFSTKKFKFKEAEELRQHLQKMLAKEKLLLRP